MMTSVDYLRLALVPSGSAPIVRIGFFDGVGGSAAFYKKTFIDAAMDQMEKTLKIAASGLEEANALEQLAIQLLLSSAYVSKPEDLNKAMLGADRFDEWQKKVEGLAQEDGPVL